MRHLTPLPWGTRVKTRSVRIAESYGKELDELVEIIPGATVNGLVGRAVRQLLDAEAPVWKAKFQEAREVIRSRQVVSIESHAR